jgi:hypothetical protein
LNLPTSGEIETAGSGPKNLPLNRSLAKAS